MNASTLSVIDGKGPERMGLIKGLLYSRGIFLDISIFAILLIVSNTHLPGGGFNASLIYIPSAVKAGQWWRIFTFPFVHVSWYHLALDGSAFFLLYKELETKRVSERFFYVIICGAFSLIATLLTSPLIYSRGLSGLSGIAHGLMAISGLEMMRQKDHFRMGLICFLLVVSKSIYETIAGDVIFSFMYFGLCGIPLAASHAGGVLGGIAAYCVGRGFRGGS